MEVRRTKNVATYIVFPIVDADGDTVSAASTLDSEIDSWSDGAAPDGFADCTNEATEIGTTGIYYLSLTQTECNVDYAVVQVKTATAGAKTQVILINFTPQVANTTQISGDSAAADNAEAFFDGTGYAGTGNTIPTVTSVTNAVTVGTINANVITATSIAADAITAAKIADGAIDAATFAAGAIDATAIATGAIDADAIAANAIGASELAADAANEIADAILDRDMSTGTDSGSPTVRTPRQALRALRNKVSIAAGTLTVTKEDDTTTSWTGAVTTAAGNPISEIDPASA